MSQFRWLKWMGNMRKSPNCWFNLCLLLESPCPYKSLLCWLTPKSSIDNLSDIYIYNILLNYITVFSQEPTFLGFSDLAHPRFCWNPKVWRYWNPLFIRPSCTMASRGTPRLRNSCAAFNSSASRGAMTVSSMVAPVRGWITIYRKQWVFSHQYWGFL